MGFNLAFKGLSSVLRHLQKDWTALSLYSLLQQCTITNVRAKWELETYGTILRQNSRTQDAFVGHMEPPATNTYEISFWKLLSILKIFQHYDYKHYKEIFMVIPCISDIKPFYSPTNAHAE